MDVSASSMGKPATAARDVRVRLVVTAVAIALLSGAGVLARIQPRPVSAVPPEPGSLEDPLVSKSYFDRFVGLQVVTVPAGKVLTCEAGAEIVLRAGKAAALGSDLGGLPDVTAGKDVQTGQPVIANHLLIIPRSDGRGLRALTEVVVMVRGAYTVSP